jgi:hypothetical protein
LAIAVYLRLICIRPVICQMFHNHPKDNGNRPTLR